MKESTIIGKDSRSQVRFTHDVHVAVCEILRKYGYPPDLQDAAVQTVLQQAEALSAEWSVA